MAIRLCALFALLAARAVAGAATLETEAAAPRGALDDLIEAVRLIIREGSEDLNLPVMDPFRLDHLNASLSKDRAYEVLGALNELQAVGLSDFEADVTPRTLPTTSAPFLRLQLRVELRLPLLRVDALYNADALLGEVVHLYGNGRARLRAEELNVKVVADIYPRWSTSELRKIKTSLEVGDFKLGVDGLLEGGIIDDLFSVGVELVAKYIYRDQKAVLEEYIDNLLFEPIEKVVNEIAFKDLLCSMASICTAINENINDSQSGIKGNKHHPENNEVHMGNGYSRGSE